MSKQKQVIAIMTFMMLIIGVPLCFGKDIKEDNYRRNSLCMFFLSNSIVDEPKAKPLIIDAINNYEFPDKYNNHCLDNIIIDITTTHYTKADKDFITKINKKGFGKSLHKVMSSSLSSFSMTDQNGKRETLDKMLYDGSSVDIMDELYRIEIPSTLVAYVRDNHIANKLIAKWFNASNEKRDGYNYDMDLIQNRGVYNANELDRLRAKESVRGEAILMDAGMELIPNTFVTFTIFEFQSMKKMLDNLSENADGAESAPLINSLISFTKQSRALFLMLSGKSGYIVTARTYLFKLIWNQTTEESFINNYYNTSPEKLLDSDEFQMEYLGFQKCSGWFTTKADYFDESECLNTVRQATIRSIDKSLAKLMVDFEEFRVKAPLIDVINNESPQLTNDTLGFKKVKISDDIYFDFNKDDDYRPKRTKEPKKENVITAFIGMKEGVTEKSMFEVLVKEFNTKKNIFHYVKVGTLKVDKNKIWDNRFTISDAETYDEDESEKVAASTVDRTHFVGSVKNISSGMLIRQIK